MEHDSQGQGGNFDVGRLGLFTTPLTTGVTTPSLQMRKQLFRDSICFAWGHSLGGGRAAILLDLWAVLIQLISLSFQKNFLHLAYGDPITSYSVATSSQSPLLDCPFLHLKMLE